LEGPAKSSSISEGSRRTCASRFAVPKLLARGIAQITATRIGTDIAEDFKQGAKLGKTTVRRGRCVGTLLKIPLC
jgi:hypothetical protein